MKLIRSDRWQLSPTAVHRQYMERTEALYRNYAQALMGVVYTHWVEISNAVSQCAAVEKLIHRTTKNPSPRYLYFSRNFPKFPSYMRRAVIQAVIGAECRRGKLPPPNLLQVSSFVTRYNRWQGGIRSRKDALPPRLTADTRLHVVLYQGQCIKLDEETVEMKLHNGKDWEWFSVPVQKRQKRHLLPNSKTLSPSLVLLGKGTYLSVPFEIKSSELCGGSFPRKRRAPLLEKPERVCAVDLGVNTTATASIVEPNGTVTARLFISCAADIDRRDKRLQFIRKKARLTMGKTGKLYKGFCQSIYRKAGNINCQVAQLVSRRLVDWATQNGASVIVFEDLKGWRPKAGKKGSTLRQRFHGWLHRMLVKLTEEKFDELGGQTHFVFARGTSSWAFDGSGNVKRGKDNYSLATFASGKQYNADLSCKFGGGIIPPPTRAASYNIGARYWASKNKKLVCRNNNESDAGKSSCSEPRTRVSLSSLWPKPPKAWSKMPYLRCS